MRKLLLVVPLDDDRTKDYFTLKFNLNFIQKCYHTVFETNNQFMLANVNRDYI